MTPGTKRQVWKSLEAIPTSADQRSVQRISRSFPMLRGWNHADVARLRLSRSQHQIQAWPHGIPSLRLSRSGSFSAAQICAYLAPRSARYSFRGGTSINGQDQNDLQKNFVLGSEAIVSLNARNQLRFIVAKALAHENEPAVTGVSVRYDSLGKRLQVKVLRGLWLRSLHRRQNERASFSTRRGGGRTALIQIGGRHTENVANSPGSNY